MTADNDNSRRVALLAKAGVPSERLRAVIDDAGAQCVLAGDPAALEPAALLEAQPQVVLVALDSSIEDALDRFETVLGDPAIDVIYEEAELISAREGWAIARWQRHLVAKLHGHADVLPPGRDPDPVQAIAAVAAAAPESKPDAAPAAYAFDPINIEFDDIQLDGPFSGQGHDPNLDVFAPPPEDMPREAPVDTFRFEAVYETPADVPAASGMDFSDFDASFDLDVASQPPRDEQPPDFDVSGLDEPVATEAAKPGSPYSFSGLTLDTGDSGSGTADSDDDVNQFQRDIGDLERRISTLELVDDTPVRGPEQARGAVLVLSGIGGPDAVRQLLGALPRNFSRPVLVQQRLEGGRYDKLVTQMQRATTLPVQLAKPGLLASPGTIYILPFDAGVASTAAGMRFTDDPADEALAALPAADSAVLLLSGSDPALVDAVLNHRWGGALVAGQAADGCYDPTAANALAARGGETAPPATLALRLAERWSSLGAEDVEA